MFETISISEGVIVAELIACQLVGLKDHSLDWDFLFIPNQIMIFEEC
jgi:hypothetical protein